MVKSPIKVIESGNVPTTENLDKGQVAFGQVGDSVKFYGSDGTTVTELNTGTQVNNLAPLVVDEADAPTAANNFAVAIGRGAKVTTTTIGGIAIGQGAESTTGVAIGRLSQADSGVSVGASARTVEGGTAVGWTARASADNATAIGRFSEASGACSVAIGYFSKSPGAESLMINSGGTLPTQHESTGNYAIAIGSSCGATGNYAIAVGQYAEATATGSMAIGTSRYHTTSATADDAISIGSGTTSASQNGIAIGYYTELPEGADDSVALGSFSSTAEPNVVSVGSGDATMNLSDDMDEETKARIQARAAAVTRRIVNVTDPVNAQDAATKNYVDTTLDQSVQRDTAISASESTVNIGVTKGNIGDKSSTTSQVALPVASATSAGVLNASTFQAIQNNAELVDSILDGTVSLDSLPSDPSQEDLTNAWKEATERDTVINGATIDDQVNAKTWRYYTNIAEWRGNDAVTPQLTVNQWSNTSAGIVKGSTTAGQIFAEADGTGSVNGWDDHESRITNNTTNITALQTNVGTLTTTVNSKADQDDLEALQTTVAGKADSSTLANYATKQELASKADTSALANYATKSELDAKADASDLADYATKAELATKADTSALADYATKAELAGKADTSDLADYATKTELSSKANASDLANYLTKTDAASTYQPVGDYVTSTAIADMETKTNAAATYATKVELATKADQSVVDSKVASVTAGTGITIGGDAQHPVINATAQKIDQYSSTESPSGNIGTALEAKQQSTLTPIGTTQGLSEGDTIIYANSYQATVTEVTGDSSTGTYSAVIFFVPTTATFATLGGQPTDNAALNSALEGKADVSAIPTVNDATVTINAYGSAVGSFTLNQAGAATISIPEPTINLVTREI